MDGARSACSSSSVPGRLTLCRGLTSKSKAPLRSMKVLRPEKEPQVRERARQISMLGTRRMHELRVMRRRRFSQHITYVLRRVPESRWDHDLHSLSAHALKRATHRARGHTSAISDRCVDLRPAAPPCVCVTQLPRGAHARVNARCEPVCHVKYCVCMCVCGIVPISARRAPRQCERRVNA